MYRFIIVDTRGNYTLYKGDTRCSDVYRAQRLGYKHLKANNYPKYCVIRVIDA